MPSLFVSHGSPMIALEPGAAGAFMQRLGPAIDAVFGRPKAIVTVSAHTAARVPVVLAAPRHEAIYDFGGFDPKLLTLRYDAPGDPALAARMLKLLQQAGIDAQRVDQGGLDHGAWTALRFIYPDADIPIVPLAFVPDDSPAAQFRLGEALRPLTEDGVLVVGSGSITHNLRRLFVNGLRPRTDQPELADNAAFRHWIAERVIDGTWRPEPVWGGIASGMVDIDAVDGAVGKDVRDGLQAHRAAIVAGTLAPFAAPLVDNAGTTRLARGTLADADIKSMDWFVAGVVGSVPKSR